MFSARRSNILESLLACGLLAVALFYLEQVREEGRSDPKVAILIPFTRSDLSRLQQNVDSWKKFPPCLKAKRRNILHLYFYYAGDYLDTDVIRDNLEAHLIPAAKATGCFATAGILTANLAASGYPMGASLMFFQAMDHPALLDAGYTHLWYMEPDCWPCRAGWAEQVWLTARGLDTLNPSWWMSGSILRGEQDPLRTYESWADHLNGNALYRLGNPAFTAFLETVQEEFSHNPARYMGSYDLAIYLVARNSLSFAQYTAGKHKFVYTNLIQNYYRKEANATLICAAEPETFFIHGRSIYF